MSRKKGNFKKTKKVLISHAKDRLINRYGLFYTQNMHDTLLNKVRSRRFKLVSKESLRVRIYDIDYELKKGDIHDSFIHSVGDVVTLRAVYDNNRKTFVTFLTEDMGSLSELNSLEES